MSVFKLQFIFGNITRKICDRPRISPWNLWDSYFKWLRGWSRIRQKVLDWPRLTDGSLCGETTLLTDKAVQFSTAKTYVFSDAVLCLGGISDEPVKAWKSRIKLFLETRCLKDSDRIDGEPMEFVWKILARIHCIGHSRRGSKDDD